MSSARQQRRPLALSEACVLLCLFAVAGCQDMAHQPKARPFSPSDFFSDGRSERPLVENTVARGSLANDALLVPKDSNELPLRVNKQLLDRGRERFDIYCAPCHGLQGDGNGMIAIRGFRHPPTFHQDRLRQAPVGYLYDVITNGFGVMPDYAAQVPPRDRWAIIAYIRALQFSRNAPAAELPAGLLQKLPMGTRPAPANAENGTGGAKE